MWGLIRNSIVKELEGARVGVAALVLWRPPDPCGHVQQLVESRWATPVQFRVASTVRVSDCMSRRISKDQYHSWRLESNTERAGEMTDGESRL